ncbi:hypothetical protein [Marinobacter sp. F3R08]|uniref:hypothetical protein n=1 Tax=Marinobacter sp. F3R08 TaxID=2841559 RepID=UPI001C09275B|nr:hypothetical protein [Marinobacter sp. F3R08]MBU2955616.1 hypothetical protein [Marinobacter sp. F3R08]
MSAVGRIFRRAFQFDLDAYFLFSDSLKRELLAQYSGASPESLSAKFKIVEKPSEDESLIDLCKEGDYFGSTDQAIKRNLALTSDREDKCIVAEHENQYVAMSWVSLGRKSLWPSFAQLPLSQENSGLLHLSYVKPEYRGHCLQRFLDLHRKHFLAEHGFAQSVSFVGVNNLSSVRNSMACNESFKLIYHVSVDIPGREKLNFFPKWNQEQWKSCRAHAERWMP